jgi:hypothetical protein
MTCARTRDGEVSCWGDNAFTSSTMSASSLPAPTRTRPARVLGVKGAVAVDVAASLGCAVDDGGALHCWTDTTADRTGPAPALQAVPTGVTDAANVSLGLASAPRACVLKRDGTVGCLSVARQALPKGEQREPGLEGVTAFATGDTISCAIRTGDKLSCWGYALGTQAAAPGPPLLENVKEVSAGSAFACAIGAAGKVTCFGSIKGTPPVAPAALVRAGVYHACIVDAPRTLGPILSNAVGDKTGGHVVCWGDDRFGQLGQQGPYGVEGVEGAIDVAVGAWHTCALEKSGRVLCWGRNARGQLGDGTSTDRRVAREIRFR